MPTYADLCNVIADNSAKISELNRVKLNLVKLNSTISADSDKSSVEGYDLKWSQSSYLKQFLPVFDSGAGSMVNYDSCVQTIIDRIAEAITSIESKISTLNTDNVAYRRTLNTTDWGMI